MTKIGAMLKSFLKNPFRAGLFALLCVAFVFLIGQEPEQDQAGAGSLSKPNVVAHVFYSPSCPHCRKELNFLETLKPDYPGLRVDLHNIDKDEELDTMVRFLQRYGLPTYQIATPFLFIGKRYLLGFHEPETTGREIRALIESELAGGDPLGATVDQDTQKKTIDLPLLGEIDLFQTSLPALAVVLGLVDGFNPCAMWVLVYLISLIIGLKDRSRIYTIIGSFLFASGVLYFLFMTAWLNVFLFLGYIHALTVLIGLAAIYLGALSLEDFFRSGGKIVCEVGDLQAREKTRTKIRHLIASPLTWATFAGIVGLAFVVNSVEFVCSSAMPAVFTHVLAVSDISPLAYYLYILLYVLFFMLDDLIIFAAAAFAVERFAGEKYAGFCKLFGGALMVGLGALLAFYPEVLR